MAKKTLILTITYNQPITDETLVIWEQTAKDSDGVVDAHATFAGRGN